MIATNTPPSVLRGGTPLQIVEWNIILWYFVVSSILKKNLKFLKFIFLYNTQVYRKILRKIKI